MTRQGWADSVSKPSPAWWAPLASSQEAVGGPSGKVHLWALIPLLWGAALVTAWRYFKRGDLIPGTSPDARGLPNLGAATHSLGLAGL